MRYLSLCLIIKDEYQYLPEWLDWHRKLGVEHFYIFDNGTQHQLRSLLTDDDVTLRRVSGVSVQMATYRHCVVEHGHESNWIGFIDTDEFIVPRKSDDLPSMLTPYETFGGLGINWLMFGTSGLLTRPESQVRSFIFRTPNEFSANDHIKSIVQPRFVLPRVPGSPHAFPYKEGAHCVNELGAPIEGSFSRNSTTLMQLNHYYCRSRQEIDEKLKRGRADTGTFKRLEDFLSVDRESTVEDRTARELKERLDGSPSSST
jgi:hypothetical protein